MTEIKTYYSRASFVESTHRVKILVRKANGETLFSSHNEDDYIYPRSAIKIFQAIPFANSRAIEKYNLSEKMIALACSSHRGEDYHVKEIKEWLNKIKISEKNLKCGKHYPLNEIAKEKLLRLKKKISQVHNNCSGKHLAMLTTCLENNYRLDSYLDFKHPHQKKIRYIFEKFSNTKIKRNNYGIDGCSAPQYSLKMIDVSEMLSNLTKSYNQQFDFNYEINLLINCITKYPKYIGGTDSLDTRVMSISGKKIFCKGGAEGVFLFSHLEKGIHGVIKVEDGNERAIPPIIYKLFKKYKIMNLKELKNLNRFYNFKLVNHAKIKVGSIKTNLK